MATKIEQVIGKIKKDGALVDAYFKTKGKYVTLDNGKTAEAAISEILSAISALPTGDGVDSKITAAKKEVIDAITGFAEGDKDADLYKAYDTLKEIADYIDTDAKAAAEITGKLTQALADITALQNVGATKVEASETNGNIKINGTETPVYVHPAKHSADDITETESKQFISAAEKAALEARAQVFVSATEPENMRDGDIWFQTVEETIED